MRHLFEGEKNGFTLSSRSLCGQFCRGADPIHLTRDQDPMAPLCPACEAVQSERREKNRKLGLYKEKGPA